MKHLKGLIKIILGAIAICVCMTSIPFLFIYALIKSLAHLIMLDVDRADEVLRETLDYLSNI